MIDDDGGKIFNKGEDLGDYIHFHSSFIRIFHFVYYISERAMKGCKYKGNDVNLKYKVLHFKWGFIFCTARGDFWLEKALLLYYLPTTMYETCIYLNKKRSEKRC